MSFKNIRIEVSYKSVGEHSISDIINPLLCQTKIYKRSVGFFSSSALSFISNGVSTLSKNNGKIYLVTSPKLSEKDIKAIDEGYKRKEIIEKAFINEFKETISKLDSTNTRLLSDLICNDILEIKIVRKKHGGMYHDKLAVLTDFEDNTVVFQGSNNESGNGYEGNYEKVRVYKSWYDYEGRIADETCEFNKIWDNDNDFLDVYTFTDAIKRSLLEIKQPTPGVAKRPVFKLRDYQKIALDKWVDNGYRGFFIMATGTGKTITALYSAKKLIDLENVFTVITAPYKHLINQWEEDVKVIFPNAIILKAYSEIKDWDKNIINMLFFNKYHNNKRIIVISTIKSFDSSRFDEVLDNVNLKKLLIVDEAHRFVNNISKEKYNFDYKLGLSATPIFGNDTKKTTALLDFFGGCVYNLPIEKAIGKYLVNYNYYPIFVNANEEEVSNFNKQSKNMASCFKGNVCIDLKKLMIARQSRLRIISTVEEKSSRLSEFIDYMNVEDHFIVYCSDGKVYNDKEDMKRNIESVLDVLNGKGFKPSKFTADENMEDRMNLIKNFNLGRISSLVAIRCLDEGINIPSIKSALILSSNDNYREFVQRRGRILRQFGSKEAGNLKENANIYDIIVLPNIDCPKMAEIELRRYYEYSRLAINRETDGLEIKLNKYMDKYGILFDDILCNTNFDDGGDLDD